MKVVPSDNDAVYYYDVLSKQILDQHHSGDLAVYMKNMMAEAVKNYGSVEEALKSWDLKANRTMHSRAGSEYRLPGFCCGARCCGRSEYQNRE